MVIEFDLSVTRQLPVSPPVESRWHFLRGSVTNSSLNQASQFSWFLGTLWWTNSSCSAFPCISVVHGSITCYRWLSVPLSASCWAQFDSLLKISNILVLSANLRMSTRQSLPRDLIHLPSCRSLQTECDDRVSSTSICWIFTSGRSFPGEWC